MRIVKKLAAKLENFDAPYTSPGKFKNLYGLFSHGWGCQKGNASVHKDWFLCFFTSGITNPEEQQE